MKKLILCFVASALIFMLGAVPKDSSPAVPKKTLRVGLFTGFSPNYKPPFVSRGHFKQFNGIAVDIWNEVAKKIGYKFEFVVIKSDPNQAIEEMLRGNYDILVGAFSITPEREKIVAFSKPFFSNEMAIAVARGPASREITDAAYKATNLIDSGVFKSRKMSVALGTSSVPLAHSLSNQVLVSSSIYEALKDLSQGKVDVAVGDSVLMAVIIKKNPEWRVKLINKPLKNEPYAFVLPPNSALKADIDKALSTMTALELSNLCEPYKIFVPSDMKLVEQCHL